MEVGYDGGLSSGHCTSILQDNSYELINHCLSPLVRLSAIRTRFPGLYLRRVS
jgi:hypothetical protein